MSLSVLLLGLLSLATQSTPLPVSPERLREHVFFLASDALEGRAAGTRFDMLAVRYLVSQLEEMGVQPRGDAGPYRQTVPLVEAGAKLPADTAGKTTNNVIGFIPGSDATIDEVVVVGAHYDHVGRENGAIHNGADDNASGTAGALEIARLLAAAPTKTRRGVLVIFFGAEEAGLIGSSYYVQHPVVPLAQTVFMLNMDMIGRSRYRTLQIGGVGTSPSFRELVLRYCATLSLTPVLQDSGMAPSDNTPFYRRGIPVLFLFTGVHEDYHEPGDDPEKLDYDVTAAVATLGLELVRDIANRPARPDFQATRSSLDYWAPKHYTGMTFDSRKGGGAEIDIVVENSPAEKSGLVAGDVVLKVRGQQVRDAADLKRILNTMPIGEPVPCTIEREGKELEIGLVIGVR